MKIKKYSAYQLAKILPTLAPKELAEIQGGYQAFGEGYAILDHNEIATVFGASASLCDLPALPITSQHDDMLSDPFYSVINPENGWFVNVEAMGYTEGDSAYVQYVNGLLSSWTDEEVSMMDGSPQSATGKFIVPISALGPYAGIWGLENFSSGNSSENSGESGSNGVIPSSIVTTLALNYVLDICLFLRCTPKSDAMIIATGEIEAALRTLNDNDYSLLSISVEPGVSTNGQRFCHFTLYDSKKNVVFEKIYANLT